MIAQSATPKASEPLPMKGKISKVAAALLIAAWEKDNDLADVPSPPDFYLAGGRYAFDLDNDLQITYSPTEKDYYLSDLS